MFDLGWTELMVIGIVALIVVGPKDLPGMFQQVGKFVGKAKGMAREFSSAMNDAADQSGVGDIKETLSKASNPLNTAVGEVKKATSFTEQTMNSGLSPERAEAADKIRKKSAEDAQKRLDAEKAAKAADAKPAAKAPAAKKPAAKKPAAKKPAAKAVAKKPAAKKPAPKKPAAQKTEGKA